MFLTRFATKVYLIHRSAQFRASKIMLDRAMAHPQIEFLTSTVVEEVLGVEEKEVKGIRVRHTVTGDVKDIPLSGFFLGIGHIPNAKFFSGQMDLDEDGYIKSKDNGITVQWRVQRSSIRSRLSMPPCTCFGSAGTKRHRFKNW